MQLKPLITFTTAIFFSGQVLAFGQHDTWTSGYAQGTAEYTVLGKGQSQLYLACESTGSQAATITFTDANGHQVSMDTEQKLRMKIDDEEEANISESESHAGADNVMWAWNKLRTGKRVTVSGTGAESTMFTLNGAAALIPEFGEHGCVAKLNIP